jgi:inorganic triphosphatase YgiF
MNFPTELQATQEIELKLTLPYSDPEALVGMLKKSASLARRKSVQQNLLSVYFDTPAQDLLKRRIALRVREVGSSTSRQWVQTLKTGGASGSALTLRGEWEKNVQGRNLSLDALENSPWREIDPDGTIYQALEPCFMTCFKRTTWQVRAKNRSIVEVALDIGQIESAGQFAPICELELELKAGESSSLFNLAQSISAHVAVVPASLSKAERGYALSQGNLDMPQRSLPPNLSVGQPLVEAAQRVIRETFFQFTENLNLLQLTDNAEVVHQARVGWRRLKSALHLFKPVLVQDHIPDISPLQTLLNSLGQLRDLDVALAETLPLIAPVYTADDSDRLLNWNKFLHSLADAAQLQRSAVRDAVRVPSVGATLLSITRYIEEMSPADAVAIRTKSSRLDSWAELRLRRIKSKLERSISVATDKDGEHHARILAKRLRYGLESMQSVLPNRLVKRWLKKAESLQSSIGMSRDLQRLHQFAVDFGAEAGLVEFLRGYGSGIAHRNKR